MTQSSSNNITILALFAGIGVLAWFLIRKFKKASPILAGQTSNAPALTVADRIVQGYDADLKTFSDAEIKKYAGWIDTIIDGARTLKSSGKTVATDQMIYNANILKSMSDANLKAVVNYWQGVRLTKIIESDMFKAHYVDNSETIPAFFRRLQDIGF